MTPTSSTLANALSATDRTITVASGTLALNDLIAVVDTKPEFLQVTELITATQARVQRGVNGTTAVAHDSGADVQFGDASLFVSGPQTLPAFGVPDDVYTGQGPTLMSDFQPSSGGGTPGGADGSLQYNNAGAFGGFGNWDGTKATLTALTTTGPATSFGEFTFYYEGTNPVAANSAAVLTADVETVAPYTGYANFTAAGYGHLTTDLANDATDFIHSGLLGVVELGAGSKAPYRIDGVTGVAVAAGDNPGLQVSGGTFSAENDTPAEQVYGASYKVYIEADVATSAGGQYSQVAFDTGTTPLVYGYNSVVAGGGTANKVYGYGASLLGSFSNVGAVFSYWGDDLSFTNTLGYYVWFDSRGVFRVREDDTFDGVGQAIASVYNPQYAKYIPGAGFFERGTLGQFNGNVFEVGTERGATITLTSLTSSSTTATATFGGMKPPNGAVVTIAGADQNEYNGTYTITRIDDDSFSYTFAGSATTPATGTITAQGGTLRPVRILGPSVEATIFQPTSAYKSVDGTSGVTDAAVVGATATLMFKDGLFVGTV